MSSKSITSALISVFYKDGLEPIVRRLDELGITLYSTGGTQSFIEGLGISCMSVEGITGYPSILGGRVKTLHPKVFGGILARRDLKEDREQISQYDIPLLDLVIVDLYPFEETVRAGGEEAAIIEKIDIGGVSLIRAAAKNFRDVCIVASRNQYGQLLETLKNENADTSLDTRKAFAAAAFEECAHYDAAIAQYFNGDSGSHFQISEGRRTPLRYGENPHQSASFFGDVEALFTKLSGKELSYNNLADVDAACQLIAEFPGSLPAFAVIKHTNVCGIALRSTLAEAWEDALAGDKESAFGGVLISNTRIDAETAQKVNEIFFEILIAPGFDDEALTILKTKKNRILLQQMMPVKHRQEYRAILNGVLAQQSDEGNFDTWNEEGARPCTSAEKADLEFANIICKHLKSNAIVFARNKQLIGKGCGQTSRIDALRQAVAKAEQFGFDTKGAVMASDAFFPFDDCARMANNAGITAIIQPGGSVRDGDTIAYCKANEMALVMTGMRHFRH